MGWDYIRGATNDDVRASLDKPTSWTEPNGRYVARRVLKTHRGAGGTYWQLVEMLRGETAGRPTETERYIVCNLIDRGGYKSMSEHMGPYYYDCPVEWLDLAPAPADLEPGSSRAEWRAEVRVQAERKVVARA